MKKHARSTLAAASALVLASLALPASVLAQDQEPPPPKTHGEAPPTSDVATPAPRSFQDLDTDGDGSISKDEAAADPALTQSFGTLDQDADGKLTSAEYQAYRPASPSR